MRPKGAIWIIAIVAALAIGVTVYMQMQGQNGAQTAQTPQVAPSTPVASPSSEPQTTNSGAPTMTTNAAPDFTTDANGLSKATVTITMSGGTIKYKFYPKEAPNTSKRIAELVAQGFYNGLTFHRVIPRFVAQGGDPQGTGAGGSGTKLKAEFNKRQHVEGAVAMARSADPDSADSQFYIVLERQPHLDNNYTVFGQVVEGMDVVRQIKPGDKMVKVEISN